MGILLVGCTGFLGSSLIYKFLKSSNYILYIAIRKKNNKNIKARIKEIFKSINLSYKKYKHKIKLIPISYDTNRNIIISERNKKKIINHCKILINALADIKFNRNLKTAALNNTVTAINWLKLFKQCKHSDKYIYISTAYVNFHRIQEGIIKEKIYDLDMSETTLDNILNDKHTKKSDYMNTYCYTKQLTEILLKNNRDGINLHIIRPSIIIPALQYPYPGWCNIQTISLGLIGASTGLLTAYKCNNTGFINTIPVDFVANDCFRYTCLKNDSVRNITISHCCLTGNIEHWGVNSGKFFYNIFKKIESQFLKNPIFHNENKLMPIIFNTFSYNGSNIYIANITTLLYNIYNMKITFIEKMCFLYKSICFTYMYNLSFKDWCDKRIIFERKINSEDILYTNSSNKDCFNIFLDNIQKTLEHDDTLKYMLR